MNKRPDPDNYSDEEAQRRFEAALRGARIAGHKTMEDVQRERRESKPARKPRAARFPILAWTLLMTSAASAQPALPEHREQLRVAILSHFRACWPDKPVRLSADIPRPALIRFTISDDGRFTYELVSKGPDPDSFALAESALRALSRCPSIPIPQGIPAGWPAYTMTAAAGPRDPAPIAPSRPGPPAIGETIAEQQARAAVRDVCLSDIYKFCSDVHPSQITGCMRGNEARLSHGCKYAIATLNRIRRGR